MRQTGWVVRDDCSSMCTALIFCFACRRLLLKIGLRLPEWRELLCGLKYLLVSSALFGPTCENGPLSSAVATGAVIGIAIGGAALVAAVVAV
jgi:hypothetical protein